MNKQSRTFKFLLAAGIFFVILVLSSAQNQASDEQIWKAFTTWIMENQGSGSLKDFGEKLAGEGLSEDEIQRQKEVIRRMIKEHPEKGIELTYDRIFSRPLTGDPKKDGFTSTPSVFMMESAKDLQPGKALDVGAGQGRNAVWLAQQGWDVTAIDISGAGLAAAEANAEKAGTSITTVKNSYEDFDYGIEQWDLIVMILSWAPVSNAAYVSRLKASLRPGGVIIFEHVLSTEDQTFPPVVQALPPNALLSHFRNFHIQKYEEGVWLGDWGGPPAELVRMIARKK
jgi:2-polyprenyl-3-methyl-5-hydroxy-6-metoxy-1,4-benzoquinol methylase